MWLGERCRYLYQCIHALSNHIDAHTIIGPISILALLECLPEFKFDLVSFQKVGEARIGTIANKFIVYRNNLNDPIIKLIGNIEGIEVRVLL